MLFAIATLIFLALVFGAASALMAYSSRLATLGAVLPYRETSGPAAVLPQEMARSLWQRVFAPEWAALTELIGRLLPANMLRRTEARLEQAGRPCGCTARSYLALQGLLALSAATTMLLLAHAHPLPPRLAAALLVGATLAAALLPNWLLDRLAAQRRRAIQTALPDAIDLLVVSVQAGLSMDAAIQELVSRNTNPLAAELHRAQAEIRAGRSREAAWHDMAARSGVTELSTFVSAVCQGERLGASISHILQTHAEAMRTRRSLCARELAAKIPVKMLFPMIFFIFPCLFVVMLGPGIIMMLHNFKGVIF